jgi:hypothetical protein
MFGQVAGGRLHLASHAVVSLWRGAAHYVSHDVAASAQRCEHRLADFMDDLPEIAFRNAMQLEPLPRGDAQRSIGKPVAQVERAEQLAARQTAAGNL